MSQFLKSLVSVKTVSTLYVFVHFNYLIYMSQILNKSYYYLLDRITKTRLYYFNTLKPHFYIVKLGFTGVYIIFLISAQKHRLWVLIRVEAVLTSTHNLCFEQKYEKYQIFFIGKFSFFGGKIFSIFV